MTGQLDIACAADLCVDVVLRGGDVRPRFGQAEQWIGDYAIHVGGSATIFAAQAAKLGARVGLAGVLGQDLFGTFLQQRLRELDLDLSRVRVDPRAKTGAGFALIESSSDRAILTYPGTIDAIAPSDLTDDLAGACRHWHIASFFLLTKLRAAWPVWLGPLRQMGRTISLDTNWDPEEKWDGVRPLLPLVDVFLPNESEALAISGETDVVAAGKMLANQGPLVVIKRGERGAIAFHGQRQHEVPLDPRWRTGPIVDTIGGGDCFDAGFVRAWQLKRPIEQCLEIALRCGTASVTAAGGFDGQLREVLT